MNELNIVYTPDDPIGISSLGPLNGLLVYLTKRFAHLIVRFTI